ncbi:MAG: peptide chain release factor 2 [Planctomycetota bacterium]
MNPLVTRAKEAERRYSALRGVFDYEGESGRKKEIEERMGRPDFWADPAAAKGAVEALKRAKGVVAPIDEVGRRLEEVSILLELGGESPDADTEKEIRATLGEVESRLGGIEFRTMMAGEHDQRNAFLSVHAGAGGVESCDWARMLLRMYTRWMDRHGFTYELIDEVPEPEGGVRSATLEVKGDYAFGHLRAEVGVHRLVRISPFDSNQRRHASFASVDVAPEMEDIEVDLNDKDLRVETMRAGGAGGQHVNKTESAVRITHIPTGIVVSCQNERSQHKNRAFAMKVLRARVYLIEEAKRDEEMKSLYGEKGEIAWGHQIRSYTLQPYQLVKDHRTDHETGQAQAVLDGEIDGFLKAYLQRRASRPRRPPAGDGPGKAKDPRPK